MWLREHNPFAYPFTSKKYTFKYNQIHRRNYSEVTNDQQNKSFIPVVIYPDAYLNKSIALKDNKTKPEFIVE